jgi:phospholipid/cholesterol/gamma-HCH transport system permease protein
MEATEFVLSDRVKDAVQEIQEFARLCWASVSGLFKKPRYHREAVYQMDTVGPGSLPIILLTGLFTGMVLALQSSVQLKVFGATIYVGKLVSLSMVRELGPVLSALMVAGRVGSGIAAEIGSMKDTEQIDAMMVEGTDPIMRLVVPRMLACILMLPLLTIVADAIGLFGGYLIGTMQLGIDPTFYWSSSFESLRYKDLVPGLFKPAFFGFIISMVGCHLGLKTHGGTVGVGRSTTESVVYSSILILSSDFFITKFFMWLL